MRPIHKSVYCSCKSHKRCSLLNLGPSVIKVIHNTVAYKISWLEYDPSVNQTAKSYYMTKVKSSKCSQIHNWMAVSKHWYNLEIDTNKHKDLNFAFANPGEEDEIYLLTTIEIAETQSKDQELKVCFEKNAIKPKEDAHFHLIKDTKVLCKNDKLIIPASLRQGSQLVLPLPPAPWPLKSQRDNEIHDALEWYA
jgi:hypothetical protein